MRGGFLSGAIPRLSTPGRTVALHLPRDPDGSPMEDSSQREVVYAIIPMGFEVRVTSGARKHALSRRRIEEALTSQRIAQTIPGDGDPKIYFVGTDNRGEEIEVVAVVLPSLLLIIHAMPTRYRRSTP